MSAVKVTFAKGIKEEISEYAVRTPHTFVKTIDMKVAFESKDGYIYPSDCKIEGVAFQPAELTEDIKWYLGHGSGYGTVAFTFEDEQYIGVFDNLDSQSINLLCVKQSRFSEIAAFRAEYEEAAAPSRAALAEAKHEQKKRWNQQAVELEELIKAQKKLAQREGVDDAPDPNKKLSKSVAIHALKCLIPIDRAIKYPTLANQAAVLNLGKQVQATYTPDYSPEECLRALRRFEIYSATKAQVDAWLNGEKSQILTSGGSAEPERGAPAAYPPPTISMREFTRSTLNDTNTGSQIMQMLQAQNPACYEKIMQTKVGESLVSMESVPGWQARTLFLQKINQHWRAFAPDKPR